MELIKQNLSIKDPESLSGIKTPNIRLREKLGNIHSPDCTPSNFRTYTNADLQKLLSISLPIGNMNHLQGVHKNFIDDFLKQLCEKKDYELHLFGNRVHIGKSMKLPEHIKIYNSINDFTKTF